MLKRFSTGGNQKYIQPHGLAAVHRMVPVRLELVYPISCLTISWQSLLTYKSVLTSVLARLFFLLTFSSCSPSFVALAQCSNIARAFSHDGTVGPEKPVCLKPRSDIPVDCGNFHRKFCIVQHVERHTVVSSLAEVPLGLVCQDCNPTR